MSIIEIKVTLEDIKPAVTRTLQVPIHNPAGLAAPDPAGRHGLDQLASLHVRSRSRDMGYRGSRFWR